MPAAARRLLPLLTLAAALAAGEPLWRAQALRAEEPPVPPAPAAAQEPAKPAQAWRDLQRDLTKGGRPAPGQLESKAKEYLRDWEASKQACAEEDYHALGLLLNAAGRSQEASEAFATSARCEGLPDVVRATSATAFAQNAIASAQGGKLVGEALSAVVREVEGWTGLGTGSSAGSLRMALGQLHGLVGAVDAALEDFALAAEAQPTLALSAGGQGVKLLVDGARDLAQVPAARERLAALRKRLEPAQGRAIEEARKALAAETDEKQRPRRAAALKGAEAGLRRLAEIGRPLELLGEAAPEWTLVKAYGKGSTLADYRGKVVVLDFWATWCPWCIRSFPALRDLLKDYAGKDLAVVGVTASAASVFDQRYDLDDDLRAKATGGQVVATLKRPTPPTSKPAGSAPAEAPAPPGPEALAAYEAALAAFRVREQEVLATFIANHQMTWDVVQIDEAEPAPKYALNGWPHCVVIDRQGRVRHFKSGALLRDKPEAVAAFRKVLDGLLAEPAPTK